MFPSKTGQHNVDYCIKPLQNDKILYWSKLKAIADDNIKVLYPFPNDKF